MSNAEIYKKTLGFSTRKFLFDMLSLVILAGGIALGFFFADKAGKGLIGLIIGAAVGIIVAIVLSRYTAYSLKAAQIAMMTRGITEDSLPDDVIKSGKEEVKNRFATVALYFLATNSIKGIFSEIGNGIGKLGKMVGGDTGESIGSAISSIIQVMVSYMCDCCLGWVFFRKGKNAGTATLEGAVIFFKKWKTLLKNMGRILGMGIASFVAIAGVFGGISYLILARFPQKFQELAEFMKKAAEGGEGDFPAFLTDPKTLMIACAILIGAIFWTMIHSVFIRPYVLVGVLRNYLDAGIHDELLTDDSFSEVALKSKKFAKLEQSIGND